MATYLTKVQDTEDQVLALYCKAHSGIDLTQRAAAQRRIGGAG